MSMLRRDTEDIKQTHIKLLEMKKYICNKKNTLGEINITE